MTKTHKIKASVIFHGLNAPKEISTIDKKTARAKLQSSGAVSVKDRQLSKQAKKLLGPDIKTKNSHGSPKTYKATEVMLDVYQKWLPNIFTYSGFRSPGRTGTVFFRNAASPKNVHELALIGNPINLRSTIHSSPTFSADGKTLVVGSRDDYIYCLKLVNGKFKISDMFETRYWVDSSASFSPDGKYIIFPGDDNRVYNFQIDADGRLIEVGRFALEEDDGDVKEGLFCDFTCASFSPDGKHVVVGSQNGNVYCFQINKDGQLEEIAKFQTGDMVRSSPAWSPNGDFFVIGSDDKAIYGLRIEDNKLIQVGKHITGNGIFSSPAFSPDGQYVVVGSRENKLMIFQANDSSLVKIGEILVGGPITSSPAFSPNGQYVVVGSEDHKIYCFRIGKAGQLELAGEFGTQRKVSSSPSFSPDGQYVVVGSDDCKIYCFRLGKEGQLELSAEFITKDLVTSSATFSPDGQSFVIGSWDNHLYHLRLVGDNK